MPGMPGEQFDEVLDRSPEGVIYSNSGQRVEAPATRAQMPRGAGVAGRTVVAMTVTAEKSSPVVK